MNEALVFFCENFPKTNLSFVIGRLKLIFFVRQILNFKIVFIRRNSRARRANPRSLQNFFKKGESGHTRATTRGIGDDLSRKRERTTEGGRRLAGADGHGVGAQEL